jgi:hypothetical protein
MSFDLDRPTRDFYRQAIQLLTGSPIPFLVGGAYAIANYTGIERHTKDFDIFLRPTDVELALRVFSDAGFQTEQTHPHWLAKVVWNDAFVDLIYRSGNAVAEVDDGWIEHGVTAILWGSPVWLCPVEEMIWSKAFVMERERFDGADIAHLLRAHAERLDWDRLLRRFDHDGAVLLAHLVLFDYIYPGEGRRIPEHVWRRLRIADAPRGAPNGENRLCRGTLLSRSQYLVDIKRWGYEDARLAPRGKMSTAEIAHWTRSIAEDGSL